MKNKLFTMSYLPAGTLLNRSCYKITGFIAQGGFGITYLAEEIGYYKKSGFGDQYIPLKHPERIVVKELYYSDYCHRDEATHLVNVSNTQKRTEFEKLVNKQLEEGNILRNLDHPNIVNTRDIFQENGTAYMVMDYIESTDLEKMVQESGKLGKEKTLRYIKQVLDAAGYIHDRKILHLDITPSNILIRKESDEAVMIDFGASLRYNAENKASNNTSKLITGMKKHFAPAEQADIDNLKNFDATFDTYAIGATCYYLITGQLPPPSSRISTGKEKIIPPSAINNTGPEDEYLDAVLMKAMAPRYHDRFDTIAGFVQMLDKEEEYLNLLNRTKELLNHRQYDEALAVLAGQEGSLPETETIRDLKLQCRQEKEKAEQEAQYEQFVARGLEWYNRNEYNLAINEFEKALILFPGRALPAERIALCKKNVAGKEKINEFLFTARQQLADGNYRDAKENIGRVLAVSPEHAEAKNLLEQAAGLEDSGSEALRIRADELFAAEKYNEALGIYQQLKQEGKSDKELERRLLLLWGTGPADAEKLKQKYILLRTELSGIASTDNESGKLLETWLVKFNQLRTEARQLSLPSGELRNLAENIYKEYQEAEEYSKAKSGKTVLIGGGQAEAAITKGRNEGEKTVIITGDAGSAIRDKWTLKKKVLYFILGAAISIGLGLLLIVTLKEKATTKKEITPPPPPPPPIPLTSEDIEWISQVVKYPDDFSYDDHTKEVYQKILNSTAEDQAREDVQKFKRMYENSK